MAAVAVLFVGCGGGGGGSAPAGPTNNAFVFATPSATTTPVSPAAGPESGNTVVTITGSGALKGTVTVFFGSTKAGDTRVIKNDVAGVTVITATSPAGVGTVDVTVVDGAGASKISGDDTFQYIPAPPPPPTTSGTTGATTGTTTSPPPPPAP